MPRPGPRPFECVRRAWHSDRHQPIRGSLIQEVFRVVNEIHSSEIKKNKEWQEKLPIVVLKAEEIMYSKANSEAEYMDLKTLWNRANDAINTIIRSEESNENGELLQPCIEAALVLGCTPRRASRSQRNTSPTCYLTASTTEANLENTTQENHTANPNFLPHYSNFVNSSTIIRTHLGTNGSPFTSEKITRNCMNQLLPIETCPPSKSCSVYPLYYGNQLQLQLQPQGPHPGFVQKLMSSNVDASNKIHLAEQNPSTGCDLSLRLGPFLSLPCLRVENHMPQEVEDMGSSSSRDGNKLNDLSPPTDKEFFCIPKANADDPLDSCSSKWSAEREITNIDATMRKRKALVSLSSEDTQVFWEPKFPCNRLTRRMSNAGP